MQKNIVLFSDGTGNGAASPFKTNVWRLYQAIDIEPPSAPEDPLQIVYYDNGVGTENFKPLAALGGAFGIGVWRNVKDLYTFVCRNYELGDQIYGFGFSRGAFTIRLLMGMISRCGILKTISEAHLVYCVQMAYEAYRRDYLIRASRRRYTLYHRILREPRYDIAGGRKMSTVNLDINDCQQQFPDIRFVGVWDTVDAYGMPVDELKMAIDKWVWPMSFADRDPSNKLLTVRHALSLDDARPTFRPVLWNEVVKDHPDDREAHVLDPNTIRQVWFAGVHANVGGGYPDDGLAYTALKWMMDEAHVVGLRYDDLISKEIAAHVNPDGEQYDSRAGIAGYYRYGPRQVSALSNDEDHGVTVPVVHVHPAAYARIFAWRRDYEPVSLNCDFSVDGARKAGAGAKAMDDAWDLVWWRRIAYFVTLSLTAFVGLFVLLLISNWPKPIFVATEAVLGRICSGLVGAIGWILPLWLAAKWNDFIAYIDSTFPHGIATAWGWIVGAVGFGWASPVGNKFSEYPLTAIVSWGLLAWAFFIWSNRLEQRIEVLAEWAWAGHKGLPAAARPNGDWRNYVARMLRPVTGWLYTWVWRGFCVNLLGVGIGAVMMTVLLPIMRLRDLRRRPWMA